MAAKTKYLDRTGVQTLWNKIKATFTQKSITGTNGVGLIFNEADGGGAKFEHNDGTEVFVGVNDGGENGMMAQIYADKSVNGQWVGSRINVYHDGIYYVSKTAQQAGSVKNDPNCEIATKGDVANVVAGEVEALTIAEIDEICV